ncbi:MAG: hypothetical protein AUJ49_02175 [Desulfovibrionaceae bacterium CG1_02_65_16]|nr:MAG: hypothetical protein AUJ49_02175 [Desulfovibrionaceae bacterium CG1_02_65_16]
MQRKVLLMLLTALAVLCGCAQRDPNLVVRGLGEFSRGAGDYTLRVNLYDLDEKGNPRLVSANDPSLTGFVTRTLATRGYVLRTSGPASYNLDVHLLCGNMRAADMGFFSEKLRVPESALGAVGAEHMDYFYWLPDKGLNGTGRETQDLRDSMQVRGNLRATDYSGQTARGGAPLGQTTPDYCQGRVLVVLTPAANGPKREIYIGRSATDDCKAVPSCPADVCRSALEQALVEMLEHRF